ncbi:MAG: 1-deoxy-D-xylulose-5-phosphate reductoisomerase, partial [bacterium]
MRSLYLLGATGSIGRQVLEVVDAAPDAFRIAVLTADTDVESMTGLVQKYHPEFAAMNDVAAAETLAMRFPDLDIGAGKAGLIRAATWNVDDTAGLLVNAIVGVAGLEPTIAAICGKRSVALANKETLVVGGTIV